jgi:hypothetical protein
MENVTVSYYTSLYVREKDNIRYLRGGSIFIREGGPVHFEKLV